MSAACSLASERLSCYVLTLNAQRYLGEVLSAVSPALDELLVIDSGSSDDTLTIARRHGARVLCRPFVNFREQRAFAEEQCRHRWVLALDADEVPSPAFVTALQRLKAASFVAREVRHDAFQIERVWYVMGRPVHAFFPVLSPDFPIRLTLRDHVRHGPGSHAVHAGPTGYRALGRVDGVVRHLACASTHELNRKLVLYSSIAARDLRGRGCRSDWARQVLSPAAAWIKWYLLKGGYRDGATGRLLAAYAYLYTRQKWRKLRELEARESQPRGCDLSRGETTSTTAKRPKRAASTR